MSVQLNVGTGGSVVRTLTKSAQETGVAVIDWGGAGAESLGLPDFATQTTLAALSGKVTACNTGAVTVVALPSLPAGANAIGSVSVTGAVAVTGTFYQATQPVSLAALPVLASGTNTIGAVTCPANTITGALPTGANTIGAVTVPNATISGALPAGTNSIGSVVATPVRGAITDRSGTVAAGGTSQALAAANTSRSFLFVLNPKAATESLWIDFGTAAVTASPSIELQPGQYFSMEGAFVATGAVNVTATTTGHVWTAKEG
jgi:hypothetical protein